MTMRLPLAPGAMSDDVSHDHFDPGKDPPTSPDRQSGHYGSDPYRVERQMLMGKDHPTPRLDHPGERIQLEEEAGTPVEIGHRVADRGDKSSDLKKEWECAQD